MEATRLRRRLGNQAYLSAVLVFVICEGTPFCDEGLLLMEGVQAFQKIGANDAKGVILCVHLLKGKLPFGIGGDEGFPIGVQRSDGGVCVNFSGC